LGYLLDMIIRLTETDLTRVINEQRTPFLTPNKSILSKSGIEGQNGGNIIYLTKRDPKTTQSFHIGLEENMACFPSILICEIERGQIIYAEVKPKNNTGFTPERK
jgi:hypothetical protein